MQDRLVNNVPTPIAFSKQQPTLDTAARHASCRHSFDRGLAFALVTEPIPWWIRWLREN
jgi:hypothetical protein